MSGSKYLLETAINNTSGEAGIPEGLVRDLLDAAYRARRKKPASLDLLFADDREMTRMNRRHLGREEATDVLAFDDGEEEDGRVRLGDVAVGVETARRVAAERGVAFEHELAFYALHGLFHLLGMRDDDDKDRAAMLRAQAKVMRDHGLELGEGMMGDAGGD